jgi:hypothetical protein
MLPMIVDEVICACAILTQGGSLVLRMGELYTMTSCKLLYILSQLFTEVNIVKPLTSHDTTGERFAVCIDYKPIAKIVEQLSKLTDIHTNTYPLLLIPKEFKATIICINQQISQRQFIAISDMVRYIDEQNFYGEAYTQYRQAQIDASKYWLSVYQPFSPNKVKASVDQALSHSNKCIKQYTGIID